jgi:hypothetical protein
MDQTNEEKNNMVYWTRKVNQVGASLYLCIPREFTTANGIHKADLIRMSVNQAGDLVISKEGGKNGA